MKLTVENITVNNPYGNVEFKNGYFYGDVTPLWFWL